MAWWILGSVEEEMSRSAEKYGPYRSTHEALGVLAEEVSELLDAIRSNDLKAIGDEAVQVASVAARLGEQCRTGAPDFKDRSGA